MVRQVYIGNTFTCYAIRVSGLLLLPRCSSLFFSEHQPEQPRTNRSSLAFCGGGIAVKGALLLADSVGFFRCHSFAFVTPKTQKHNNLPCGLCFLRRKAHKPLSTLRPAVRPDAGMGGDRNKITDTYISSKPSTWQELSRCAAGPTGGDLRRWPQASTLDRRAQVFMFQQLYSALDRTSISCVQVYITYTTRPIRAPRTSEFRLPLESIRYSRQQVCCENNTPM